MKGFYLSKFDELATFNADADKTKYSAEYLEKMAGMQAEYDDRLIAYANANGMLVHPSSTVTSYQGRFSDSMVELQRTANLAASDMVRILDRG